jgi:hypothetical protein
MTESRWMALTSEIKRSMLMPDYLTPPQLTAHDWMVSVLERPGVASLHGAHGAGKTFTAWVAARSAGARYLPIPKHLEDLKPDETEAVVIDNAPTQETALRRLIARCDLYRIRAVVFISPTPNALRYSTHAVPPPTHADMERVARQWMRRGYYQYQPLPQEHSFWALLRAFSIDSTANEA